MKTSKQNRTPIFIGIDPGASGGFAVLFDDCSTPRATAFKSDADFVSEMQDLASVAQKERRPVHVSIEKVGGFVGGKGNTGSSMFKFGHNAGFELGVCQALGFAVEYISPAVWQKLFPCKTKHGDGQAHKRELRDHAFRLFPACKPTLATADALLILAYALKQRLKLSAAASQGEGK